MNVYEVLEQCLLEIEQGADMDTVLFRHPEYADELRPMLEASVMAKAMVVTAPSTEVVRRNRAKLLQRAAEMREAKVKPSSRVWAASLRRLVVTLAVVAVLFTGSTGLVRASSNTIPGDNLYPVKRTWEDALVLFTFDPQQREQLEFEHENERLDELNELIAEGRSAEVDFSGYVTRQTGTGWRVSAISVITSPQTDLPSEPISVGAAVRVTGLMQNDGAVLAQRIKLLPAGMKLPEVQDDDGPEIEQENSGESNQSGEGGSGSGSENEAPKIEATKTPDAESGSIKESFEGILESVDNAGLWVVNGRVLDVSAAEIKGSVAIGASVKVEGYAGADGVFRVTKAEVHDASGGSSSGGDDDSSDDKSGSDD
jgi:hypothetical protein